MRRPNGCGTVVKLSGKRTKPYCAKVTCGWNYDEEKDKLIQIQKTIGTFATYEAADRARSDYVYDPYDIDAKKITFCELYKLWERDNEHKKNAKKYYATPFRKLKHIYNTPFHELKVARIQNIINEACDTESTRSQMKSLFNCLTDFAAFLDIVNVNKCNLIDITKNLKPAEDDESSGRIPYTLAEMKQLMALDDDVSASIMLMILTGMRVDREFLSLRRDNIDYEKKVIHIVDSKTGNGIRYIPISKYADPYLHRLYDNNMYAFRVGMDKKYAYNKYREKKYNDHVSKLGLNHIPYDCRHTFATLTKRSGMDELTRKRIFGHSIKDFTDRVYTSTEYQDLMAARKCFDDYLDKIFADGYVEEVAPEIRMTS
ncbi:MAG: tyrosine-type recombinase/integrase [bacterium]|nr:tyrosine-type recombinase/integrase [bacterium]